MNVDVICNCKCHCFIILLTWWISVILCSTFYIHACFCSFGNLKHAYFIFGHTVTRSVALQMLRFITLFVECCIFYRVCFFVLLQHVLCDCRSDAVEGLSLFSSVQAGVPAQCVRSVFHRPPRCHDVQVSNTAMI